jgi:hypothetical protein
VKRFIEWDSLDVRVSGEKFAAMAKEIAAKDPMLERMDLKFENGLLRVEGAIRKVISVPFTVEIRELVPNKTTVRVPLSKISAGPLPIPKMLLGLLKDKFPKDVMTFEEPATFVVSLDRFLPPFVTADIQKIWIIDGGLAVTLGKGGADLPGGNHV